MTFRKILEPVLSFLTFFAIDAVNQGNCSLSIELRLYCFIIVA